MKVVHLNTHNEGGSYEYAALLSRGLRELGVDSRVLTRDGCVRPISDKLLRRGTLAFSKGAWHGTLRRWVGPDPELMESVDVVHFHTVADWFDVPRWLENLPKRVSVVIGLHDLWHVSGGCFVYGSCEGFRCGCSNCPLLHFPANRFFARSEVHKKAAAYGRQGCRFVANSFWLKSLAESSTVVGGCDVSVIPPPVDTSIFHPLNRDVCRAEFGLKDEDLVVVTGCASLTDKNKDVLGMLEILASLNEPRLRVLVFGDGVIESPQNLQVAWLGLINSKERLAQLYNAADVFVSASKMESYGLTLVEALGCGTRVAAYRVGGIPEAVPPIPNAVHLADAGDRSALKVCVRELLDASMNDCRVQPEVVEGVFSRNGISTLAKDTVRVYREFGL